jgi:hypothetical protein
MGSFLQKGVLRRREAGGVGREAWPKLPVISANTNSKSVLIRRNLSRELRERNVAQKQKVAAKVEDGEWRMAQIFRIPLSRFAGSVVKFPP